MNKDFFKKTNISKLVVSLVERLSPRFKEITIRSIIQDLDLIVLADTTRISAVVENLIANTAKYAPNSTLKIKLEEVDGDAQLSFEDNGPGIPDQYIDKIFTKFFRVPTNTSSVRGTGLGLFICKQIIKAHQGTISVVSNGDKGTKFIIKLPLCKDD